MLAGRRAGRLDEHDAVLGPAADGGWWALGLRDPRHAHASSRGVPDVPRRHRRRTLRALHHGGLRPRHGRRLSDVDTMADACAVAGACPDGRFARAVAAVDVAGGRG